MTCAQQVIMIPAAFAAGVQALAAETGALTNIAYGEGATSTISYDDLDGVPETHGPLIDLDRFASEEPLTVEELMENEFYHGIVGSPFGRQRSFLQAIVDGLPPELYQSVKLSNALQKRFPEDHVRLGTASFIEGVALMKSGEEDFGQIPYSLTTSSSHFLDARLVGAAGIASTIQGIEEESPFRQKAESKRASLWSSFFLKSMANDGLESKLGSDYLYGLHGAKHVENWMDMQALFFKAGRVHANRERYGAAVRAYIASLWVFSQRNFARWEERNFAMRALGATTDLAFGWPGRDPDNPISHHAHRSESDRLEALRKELVTAAKLPSHEPPEGGYFTD